MGMLWFRHDMRGYTATQWVMTFIAKLNGKNNIALAA